MIFNQRLYALPMLKERNVSFQNVQHVRVKTATRDQAKMKTSAEKQT